MSVVGVDVDGTLLRHDGEIDYSDPEVVREVCKPDEEVCRTIRTLGDLHQVLVITGRVHAILHDLTITQLEDAGLETTWDALHMQNRWEGYEAMTEWKAEILEEPSMGNQVDVYIGDTRWDQRAARMAGTRYVDVDALREATDHQVRQLARFLS